MKKHLFCVGQNSMKSHSAHCLIFNDTLRNGMVFVMCWTKFDENTKCALSLCLSLAGTLFHTKSESKLCKRAVLAHCENQLFWHNAGKILTGNGVLIQEVKQYPLNMIYRIVLEFANLNQHYDSC